MTKEFPTGKLGPQEISIKEHFKNRLASWSDLLSRLQKNEVGRALVSARYGGLVGYILPLDLSNDSHLIIFDNGFMAVTHANENPAHRETYRSRTGKNVRDYLVGQERPADILKALDLYPMATHAVSVGAVTATNETQETETVFKAAAESALEVIRRNIVARKKIIIETTGGVSNTLNSMLAEGILV